MPDKKISDLDVIEFLVERREKLATELKSIEATIAGLKSETTFENRAVINENKPHKLQESPTRNSRFTANAQKSIRIPEAYNPSDSLDKRLLFVIQAIGRGNRDDILDAIKTKYEPDANFDRLEANVKVRLSFLLKSGLIHGERKGRFYQYSMG